ncbi:MAG TPA: O-antigen ligase family protein [Candidatus Sulfotelmatobacter sp.]|nr:O-antigen ligase family protein [Candidatus Sulfotelmatobacter sp.]
MPRPPLSYLYVLSVPYFTAMSSISYPGPWGLQYTGFIWSCVLAVGVLLILQHRKTIAFPWKVWCPWFGYVLLSLSWGGIHWLHNLQDPAQMISPLIVGTVASFAIRTQFQLEGLMRGFTHCLLFVAAAFIFFWYGPGAPYQEFNRGYNVRPAAVTVAFIACLFVGRLHKSAFGSALGWAACLAITILSGSRTATLVVLILWLVTPLYLQLKSRLFLSGAMCLAGLALFYSPVFQERFFPSGHGTPEQVIRGEFSGSGRFEELWPVVWQAAQKNIVFGAGAGEVGRFIEKTDLPDPSPLNGYLKVVFDYGAVGLLIVICTVLKQMHYLHKLVRRTDSAATWALTAAYLGFVALLIFASTEDIWLHNVNFLHPLFAFTGAAIGVTVNKNLRSDQRGMNRQLPFVFSDDSQTTSPGGRQEHALRSAGANE